MFFRFSGFGVLTLFVHMACRTDCLVDFHEMAPLYSMNRNPEVDFRVSLSPAQSESVKPNKLVSPLARSLVLVFEKSFLDSNVLTSSIGDSDIKDFVPVSKDSFYCSSMI